LLWAEVWVVLAGSQRRKKFTPGEVRVRRIKTARPGKSQAEPENAMAKKRVLSVAGPQRGGHAGDTARPKQGNGTRIKAFQSAIPDAHQVLFLLGFVLY